MQALLTKYYRTMNNRYLLALWLTGKCNLQCKYCYASENEAVCDMTFDTAKRIIDCFCDVPIKIQFAGGEPLLNFSLIEQICQYVKIKNIDAVFQLQTNGTLLDETIISKLKKYSVATGISLDGTPEINNLLRGKTTQVVNGIRMMGMQGITVGVNTVVTNLNVEALPKLVDFVFYLGNVGGIGLDLLRYAGRGKNCKEILSPRPDQLKNALIKMHERSLELDRLFGRKIQIREVETAKRRLREHFNNKSYCYASCGRSVVVLPDGKLYPCGSLLKDEFYMGNVNDFRRDSFISLDTVPYNECFTCRFETYCPKGCPSRKIRNNNSLDCVLLKTSFELAEREINANNN